MLINVMRYNDSSFWYTYIPSPQLRLKKTSPLTGTAWGVSVPTTAWGIGFDPRPCYLANQLLQRHERGVVAVFERSL